MLLPVAADLAILATLSVLAIFLHLVRIFLKLSFFKLFINIYSRVLVYPAYNLGK
jgi:hypothetical protein